MTRGQNGLNGKMKRPKFERVYMESWKWRGNKT